MMGRSTRDINTLGSQHIRGAFFFSRNIFEWVTAFLVDSVVNLQNAYTYYLLQLVFEIFC